MYFLNLTAGLTTVANNRTTYSPLASTAYILCAQGQSLEAQRVKEAIQNATDNTQLLDHPSQRTLQGFDAYTPSINQIKSGLSNEDISALISDGQLSLTFAEAMSALNKVAVHSTKPDNCIAVKLPHDLRFPANFKDISGLQGSVSEDGEGKLLYLRQFGSKIVATIGDSFISKNFYNPNKILDLSDHHFENNTFSASEFGRVLAHYVGSSESVDEFKTFQDLEAIFTTQIEHYGEYANQYCVAQTIHIPNFLTVVNVHAEDIPNYLQETLAHITAEFVKPGSTIGGGETLSFDLWSDHAQKDQLSISGDTLRKPKVLGKVITIKPIEIFQSQLSAQTKSIVPEKRVDQIANDICAQHAQALSETYGFAKEWVMANPTTSIEMKVKRAQYMNVAFSKIAIEGLGEKMRQAAEQLNLSSESFYSNSAYLKG